MKVSRRALIGSAGLGLASLRPRKAHAQPRPPSPVTLAVSSTSFVLGGVRIGEKAGIFEQNGIALKIVVMDSGNAAMSALLGGSVPFAVTGPADALIARARGQDLVIVANLYSGLAGSVILAKAVTERLRVAPDAPIKDRLAALNGLVMAVPSATSALLAPVKAAVEGVGAKIRFTYIAQGLMPAALENNAIDSMIASFPFAGTPLLRGTGVLWINGPGGDLPPEVLPSSSSTAQTTGEYARSNRDVVRRLQQSVTDIAAFIEKDPTKAKSDLAAGYPQLSAAEIDLAYAQQWKNWTKPFLTVADIEQELKLVEASSHAAGLKDVDLGKVLVGPG